MKLPEINILDEKNKLLHKKSEEVQFPITDEFKQTLEDMLTYLEMSQIDKYSEKYDLRPGMGLACVQIGIPKRAFVICNENEWYICDIIKLKGVIKWKYYLQFFLIYLFL